MTTIPVVNVDMPQEPYLIPVDQAVVGILNEVMVGVHVASSMATNGVRQLPSIRFRKMSGNSIGNSPAGGQSAAQWMVQFDCLHDSRRNAELLASWLYRELEKLVDPSVPGHNPVTHEGVWISNVEESDLPDRSIVASGLNLTEVQISFVLTFRRQLH